MQLLRLEMQGFKSFAEKTIIEFGSGVTGIVGPNGCGKSNIADAIRWVLGEQSLKNLRGSKSEDVIFSGSSGRRALNLAEVTLTFDNQDRFFPLDYEEISVGRRVYRSSEGVYLLNRKQCRLKDIVDLFRDTGLGKDALAVLGQNKIDELLSCSPEERRSAFEELAGISRFKNRKKDALKRMEQTEQNLLRVQDLMINMAEELPALEEAKKKTEAYQEIKKEMRAGEIRWVANEWEKLSEQEKKLKEEEQGFSFADKTAEENREKRAREMEELDRKITERESTYHLWQEEMQKLQNRIQDLHTEIAVQSERVTQNQSLYEILKEDASKRSLSQEENSQSLAEVKQKLEAAQKSHQEKKAEFEKMQKEQETIQTRWTEIQSQIEMGRDEGFSSLQEIVSFRNRNQTLKDELTRYDRQEEKFIQEKTLLIQQQEEIHAEIARLKKERVGNQEALVKYQSSVAVQSKALEELEAERIQFSKKLENLKAEKQDVHLRLRWLGDMLERHEGFSQGVRSILQAKASWRKGILGTVADLFQVQPEYRIALEVALGSSMQNVICQNENDAREGIAYLKSKKSGRVTFLPLSTLQASESKKEEVFLREKGCLGRASDFVSVSDEVEKAARFLLSRTLVVDNMETALELGRKSKFTVRIVTLQGEILRPGGSITGGSSGREKESFWARREEQERLQKLLVEKEKDLASMETEEAELIRKKEFSEESIEKMNREIQELGTKLRVLQEQKNYYQQREKGISEEVADLEVEISEVKKQKREIQENLHQIETSLQKAQQKEDERKVQMEKLQQESSRIDSRKDQYQQELTRLQVEVYGSEQECQHMGDRASEIQAILENEKKTLADVEKKMEEIQSLYTAGTQQLEAMSEEKSEKENSLQSVAEGTQKAEKDWKTLASQKQEKEKENLLLEREENKFREKRHEWEMRFQRLSFEQEKWILHLKEEFDMSVEEALGEADAEISLKGLSDRLAILRNRISEIGEINPYAIEEYQRHQERYSFYETQSRDLQDAKSSLQRLLNELNREMAEQFEQTFEEVRQRFQRIFLELFGGGKAELSLTDPKEVLESGVEIFVQPPGKKLQNMLLLSGGERALTVIALLFSFMECRPSPFYLADEVDAALDEANVRRFSQFLKEYSSKSQFIVVTHRRGTMEIADTLHGITMEDAGVSKLISVRFDGDQPMFESN